jgi:hypothetical protein
VIYCILDESEKPVYVGRTTKGVNTRLNWHRRARNARWLKASNADLARWLQDHVPSAVMLAEVPDDSEGWPTERAFIRELAPEGLLNVVGNPLRSPKRRGGRPPSAAAA